MSIYKRISNHKNLLMGIAIVIIVLYHSQLNIDSFPLSIINYPISIGFAGVDIFMLLSGFGLFYSLENNSDTLSFYQRRIKRILPFYYPVIVIYIVYLLCQAKISGLEVISNLFFVSWWIDYEAQFNWYVQFILGVYLITPVLYKMMKRSTNIRRTICLMLLFSVLFNIPFWGTNKFSAFARMPIFIIGMYFAYCQKNQLEIKELVKKKAVGIYLISVFAYIGLYFIHRNELLMNIMDSLQCYILFFVIPGICIGFSELAEKLQKIKIFYSFNKAIEVIGICSFEIYLIHILILSIQPQVADYKNLYRIFFICGSILLGILYHYGIEFIISGKKYNHVVKE